MRYPRKLVLQLYLLVGHIYKQEMGLIGINHESSIHVAHSNFFLGL
jgi:hypothetical protein